MSDAPDASVTFITGTDTGVGKTVLTGLLLCHLQRELPGVGVMKPFCTGNRDDVALFRGLMSHPPEEAALNPFFYPEPLAPWAAMRRSGEIVSFDAARKEVELAKTRNGRLLVEGVGGLMVPLGPDYFVADLIQALQCRVIVAAANRLGVLNQTLLTVYAVRPLTPFEPKVVLMDTGQNDVSSKTNPEVLAEILAPIPVHALPFLGEDASSPDRIRENEKNLKKSLADLMSPNTLYLSTAKNASTKRTA